MCLHSGVGRAAVSTPCLQQRNTRQRARPQRRGGADLTMPGGIPTEWWWAAYGGRSRWRSSIDGCITRGEKVCADWKQDFTCKSSFMCEDIDL
uniref:Uncharacterized protein n=1 Tax=Arundo donax TaxID=35708 RepID=A0A0A9AKK4_ARUDO